jgi:hypothetical protein
LTDSLPAAVFLAATFPLGAAALAVGQQTPQLPLPRDLLALPLLLLNSLISLKMPKSFHLAIFSLLLLSLVVPLFQLPLLLVVRLSLFVLVLLHLLISLLVLLHLRP